jgi:hypothetical protein
MPFQPLASPNFAVTDMPEPVSIQYEFTDALAERAANSYIRANLNNLDSKFWTALAGLVLFVVLLGLAVLLGIFLDMDWWILIIPIAFLVIFGGMLLILLLLHFFTVAARPLVRWNVRRQMMAGYQDLADRTIRWTFADDRFQVHSGLRDREVPWEGLRRIRVWPGFWALGLKGGPDLMLPMEFLPVDVQRVIRRKAREAGVAFHAEGNISPA